ncbi:MAG: LysE family transporter, partial [Bdellovibrionota bacterium]
MILFIEGALLGFAISAPVGPINLLCMRRSLTHGKRIGLLTGLGAATGDAFYGAVAAFGLTAISDFFIHYQTYFQLIGGLVFITMALMILKAKPAIQVVDPVKMLTGKTAFISTLALTLTNPATIIAFLTAFASLKFVVTAESFFEPTLITFGVFVGSAAWWLILSYASATFAAKFTAETVERINKAAGVLLLVFG